MAQLIFWMWFVGIFGNLLVPAYGQSSDAPLLNFCKVEKQDEPPLFVVPTGFDPNTMKDAKENKREDAYRNYYSAKSSRGNKTADRVIPKRSVVRIDGMYKKLLEDSKKSREEIWFPVTVVSTPPENTGLQKASLQGARRIARPDKAGTSLKTGDKGFMKFSDLEQLGRQDDFVFMVKKDSILYESFIKKLGSDRPLYEPLAVSFKKDKDGKYEVNKCCADQERKVCEVFPIFHLSRADGKSGIDLLTNQKFCPAVMDSIVPIDKKFLAPIAAILNHIKVKDHDSIADINFVDSRGFIQIPLFEKSATERVGPFGSEHTEAERGDGDAYLQPMVACGFIQALKTWDKTCNGASSCSIEFKDASHAFYKTPTGGYNVWPHHDHGDGECIDINVSRMDATQRVRMIQMLSQLGPDTGTGSQPISCLTSDATLIRRGVCSSQPNHPTHIHTCFPTKLKNGQPNQKLMKACTEGVK